MGNFSTNVYAKFRCAPLRIKKALGIFRHLELIPTIRTTRVGSKKTAWVFFDSRCIILVNTLSVHLQSSVTWASVWTQMSACVPKSRKQVSHCFCILRQLRSIRRSLSHSVFQSLVASLVLARLDFGYTYTLADIPSFKLYHLQAVTNAADRLDCVPYYDHITPLPYRVHWLHAPERIS